MKRWQAVALIALCCALLTGAAGCPLTQPDAEGRNPLQKTGQAISTVAPLVPGPWGIIAGAAGTLLAGIGSVFGSKARAAAIANGESTAGLNPWLKITSERKWLFPTIGAAISFGNAAGLWRIAEADLYPLLAFLGLPAAGEFIKDARSTPTPGGNHGVPS